MALYLVSFDIHGAPSPPGNLYPGIYHDIQGRFGGQHFCKDFGQFCLVRSDMPVGSVKDSVKSVIDQRGNSFTSRDIVVLSVGDEISISRGRRDDALRDFRRFFVEAR